jgi:predicted RNase H-like nuclease
MTTLLIGFDSAWTPNHSGALAGVLQLDDGSFHELGPPRIVDFPGAEEAILRWQAELVPTATIVLLDQPTIVKKDMGQRPVENIVGSPVSLRYGGMQPANTAKAAMFGKEAPVWPFLARFGGPANPLERVADTRVIETYPVLAMIALGWMLPDSRPTGRLPKYNPARRKTFSNADWRHVCGLASCAFRERGLLEIVQWVDSVSLSAPPRKSDQDCLDACLCLLVALDLAQGKDCLMVGEMQTGYIVVPYSAELCAELETRCSRTHLAPSELVRAFRLKGPATK